MSDKLPKVSIAVVGVVIAQIGGFIWWTAQQASTIQNLEETVNVLTVENNATDRTNLMRDVEENKERIDEIIDYIVEVEEDGEETIDDIYSEFEDVYETQEGFILQFNQIIKLQARVKTLENTIEYLTRRPMDSDGR
jgi:uncharacterized protein HemX|tara:strand:+ start:227 stop:637 length:411 start_codon:yes stop_codon:yes gene_type:complete